MRTNPKKSPGRLEPPRPSTKEETCGDAKLRCPNTPYALLLATRQLDFGPTTRHEAGGGIQEFQITKPEHQKMGFAQRPRSEVAQFLES